MERLRRRGEASENSNVELARPAPPVRHDQVLALQRGAGNAQTARMLARARMKRTLARALDTDFEHGGTPTEEETRICDEFGRMVGAFTDQAHLELLGGRVKEWKGAKFAAFLKLLNDEKPVALIHAGSAIEERVYALMDAAKMPAPWTAQFSAAMGGASKPDIVINLTEDREGLIDITSQRAHILGKGSGWTTSKRYVYVAEAWFPSIWAEHLPIIRKAIKAGGMGPKELEAMRKDIADQRKRRKEAREQELAEARELFNSYGGTTAAFVRGAFDGDKGAAYAWMREHGLGQRKGVPKRKGKRRLDYKQKADRRRKAAKQARKLESAAARERRKEKAEELRKQRRATKVSELRAAAAQHDEEEESVGMERDEESVEDEAQDEVEMGGVQDDEQEDEGQDEVGMDGVEDDGQEDAEEASMVG